MLKLFVLFACCAYPVWTKTHKSDGILLIFDKPGDIVKNDQPTFIENREQFRQLIINHHPENYDKVVVFSFNNLFSQHFSKYFHLMHYLNNNIQNIEQHSTVFYNPSITDITSTFESSKWVLKDLTNDPKISAAQVNDDSKVLVLDMITVPTNGELSQVEKSFISNSNIIENTINMAPAKTLFILSCENSIFEFSGVNFAKRRLESNLITANLESTNGIVESGKVYRLDKCLLFFISQFSVQIGNEPICDFSLLDADFTKSVCNEPNTSLTLDYTGLGTCNVSSVSLTMQMVVRYNYWLCEKAIVIIGRQGTNVTHETGCPNINAPYRLSFSCFDQLFNFDNGNIRIRMNYFQIQTSNVRNGKFSYANDCVGFFTIAMIYGLISAFVLSLILAWGLIQLFAIKLSPQDDDLKMRIQLGE